MGNSTRQLAITRRFSLADVGEGWQDCYIDYRPQTIGDIIKMSDSKTNKEAMVHILDTITSSFVAGKIKLYGEVGLADMAAEDIGALPVDVQRDLFSTVTGKTTSPKASAQDQGHEDELMNSDPATATS